MKVISINAGSSSLKFQMYEMPEEKVLISGTFERIGISESHYTLKINGEKLKREVELPNHAVAVEFLVKELIDNKIIESLDEIKGIGHRVVHGGDKYSASVEIDDEVIKDITDLCPLAPLHNPAHLIGIDSFVKYVPNAVQVACFDTAFHQTIEEDRFRYAIPTSWYKDYAVRKYGFHGTSHQYVSLKIAEILGREDLKIIICHLGNGGSLSAVRNGKCIDTSMSFTPNAGIVMGTRSGDIDYSMISYIMKKTGMTVEEIDNDLNKKSGLIGVSGLSNDFRDLQENRDKPEVELALKLYINSVVSYIAKYYVELEGVDAICFTAGVGENDEAVRRDVINSLNCLGIKLDEEANINTRFGASGLISSSDSSVPCYVVPTNEELMIARDTFKFLK